MRPKEDSQGHQHGFVPAATPAEAPQQQGVKRDNAELCIDEGALHTCAGTDLAPLAKRIPTLKTVSDPEEFCRKQVACACLVPLVDWACNHEDKVPTVWSYIATGQLKVGDNSSEDMFAEAQ